MTKAELVQKIHAKSGLATKAQAESALDALVGVLTEAMKAGDPVTFTGFGSFKVANRAARKGRNPRTGKEIDIPAGKAVKFTAGKALKEAVK
ncbi:MAG: HU family DNA-binding protein [Desulfovibrio sp.]|jgi:DNA-binding protein HU-beta|nr:HU family DNA-binding protein [Desulfovibrio sp.]